VPLTNFNNNPKILFQTGNENFNMVSRRESWTHGIHITYRNLSMEFIKDTVCVHARGQPYAHANTDITPCLAMPLFACPTCRLQTLTTQKLTPLRSQTAAIDCQPRKSQFLRVHKVLPLIVNHARVNSFVCTNCCH